MRSKLITPWAGKKKIKRKSFAGRGECETKDKKSKVGRILSPDLRRKKNEEIREEDQSGEEKEDEGKGRREPADRERTRVATKRRV